MPERGTDRALFRAMPSSSFRRSLLHLLGDLQLATQAGAALAAVGFAASCGSNSLTPSSSIDLGEAATNQSSEAGAGGALTSIVDGGAEPSPLTPYPESATGCSGKSYDAGYDGQCCVSAHCYDPDGASCLSADAPELRERITLPIGSGTCGCVAVDNHAVSGPYAPNPDVPPSSPGTCCYLVGSITCTGRPLVLDGMLVLAPVIARGDWGLALV
jgi:hypothetical protein